MTPHPLIPASFAARIAGRPADPGISGADISGDGWLRRLPRLVDDTLARWDLHPDGAPRHGECALAIPVRRAGEELVLKLTWPHAEARHEHLALRHWNGDGAVRLLAADPAAYVLLLERLDADRALTGEPILSACEVIGRLLVTLDRPASPQFVALSDKATRWSRQLTEGTPLVPRRLTEQARAMLRHLLTDGVDGRLVHEDLHDQNVLASLDPGRGDWLAIDPKPVSGEWAYAVAPSVWNRADAAAAAHSLRTHARLRADVVAGVAGLDPERVRQWTFVRLVLNAVWHAADAPSSDPRRARMIALAKAFAD